MKLVFANILLLSLFLHTFTKSQTQPISSVTIDGRTYASLILQQNLPEFPPLKKVLISDVVGASIPLPDTLGTLFICIGRDVHSIVRYFILHKRNDGTATTSTLDFSQLDKDTVRTTEDVRLRKDRQTPFPLDLRIVITRNQLLYRWLLSSSDNRTPGGKPTPADLLLDIGKPFPDLTLTDLKGTVISTTSLRGKPAIINLWTTWCSGCIDEMPGFDSLVSIFGERISYLAIAQNSAQEVVGFLKSRRFRFSHTLGNDSTIQWLGAKFPHTIVIDASGIIHLNLIGGERETYKEVEKAVNAVLRN